MRMFRNLERRKTRKHRNSRKLKSPQPHICPTSTTVANQNLSNLGSRLVTFPWCETLVLLRVIFGIVLADSNEHLIWLAADVLLFIDILKCQRRPSQEKHKIQTLSPSKLCYCTQYEKRKYSTQLECASHLAKNRS